MKLEDLFNFEKVRLEETIADARDRRTYWFIWMVPFATFFAMAFIAGRDLNSIMVPGLLSTMWVFVTLMQRFYAKACMDTLRSDVEEEVSIRVREELARHGIGTAEQESSSGDAAQAEGESGE